MTRVPALEVLGLVALRRGEPSAAGLLDRAWALAVASGELQRIRPIACARAEAAWLAGDDEGVDEATAETYELALRCGHAWDVGALAVWRARAGCLAEPPPVCRGALRARARRRASRGEPALARARASRTPRRSRSPAPATRSRCSPRSRCSTSGRERDGGRRCAAGCARPARRASLGARARRRAATRPGSTPRQAEILDLVADGLTNAQIAERLVLSAKTVEHHVAAILAPARRGHARRGRRRGAPPGARAGLPGWGCAGRKMGVGDRCAPGARAPTLEPVHELPRGAQRNDRHVEPQDVRPGPATRRRRASSGRRPRARGTTGARSCAAGSGPRRRRCSTSPTSARAIGCSTWRPAPATRRCRRPSASARPATCSRPTSPRTSSTSPPRTRAGRASRTSRRRCSTARSSTCPRRRSTP